MTKAEALAGLRFFRASRGAYGQRPRPAEEAARLPSSPSLCKRFVKASRFRAFGARGVSLGGAAAFGGRGAGCAELRMFYAGRGGFAWFSGFYAGGGAFGRAGTRVGKRIFSFSPRWRGFYHAGKFSRVSRRGVNLPSF